MSNLARLREVNWGHVARGLYDYHIGRRLGTVPPRQLVLDVTYRCNSRCAMCNIWQGEKQPEMDLAQFEQVLADPVFSGMERLMISGGESTLRADLHELVRLCFSRMPALRTVSMITNGLWPERAIQACEQVARLSAERGVSLSLSVSLDGLEETHNRMRNIPDAFKRTIATLDGLQAMVKSYRFYLGVGTVICHWNLHEMEAFQDWCARRGLTPGFQLVGFHDTYVDNMEQQSELGFRPEDLPTLYALLESLASRRSLRNWMAFYWNDMLHMYRDGRPRSSPCPFQVDAFVLDALGNVRACETAPNVGNCLQDGTCSELYLGERMAASRREMIRTVCRRCNSGCMVPVGLRKEGFKYARFLAGI